MLKKELHQLVKQAKQLKPKTKTERFQTPRELRQIAIDRLGSIKTIARMLDVNHNTLNGWFYNGFPKKHRKVLEHLFNLISQDQPTNP